MQCELLLAAAMMCPISVVKASNLFFELFTLFWHNSGQDVASVLHFHEP